MGYLREPASSRVCLLEDQFVIGRASNAGLHLDDGFVSAQHAGLRWTGRGWELRDLGSRNGTFLDGERVPPGQTRTVQRGARIAFGRVDHEWRVEDDSGPQPAAIPLSSDRPPVQGPILGIPSADDPRTTLYCGPDGVWMMERPDEARVRIVNGTIFDVDGELWRFSYPVITSRTTTTVTTDQLHEVQRMTLRFAVSRDEEHVEVEAELDARRYDLGSRAHHYLLVTLARQRMADAKQGLPETACGWVHQDDLVRQLDTNVGQLNIEIFRIRKQFASCEFADAASIVERRSRAKQLRIGARDLHVRLL